MEHHTAPEGGTMKKLIVVIGLMLAATSMEAATHRTRAKAVAKPAAQAQKRTEPAKRLRTKAQEDPGFWSCLGCFWNYGLTSPLTPDEQLKYDMCRYKNCN